MSFRQNQAQLNIFWMVGAEIGEFSGLSQNDRGILSRLFRTLSVLRVPSADPIRKYEAIDYNTNVKAPVEVINREKVHGGRDFFLERGKPDVLSLCNIPEEGPVDDDEINKGHSGLSSLDRYNLRNKFGVSQEYSHDIDNWTLKIADLRPKIVLVSGNDSFDPAELRPEGYYSVSGVGCFGAKGFLVAESYVRENWNFFIEQESPMLQLLEGRVSEHFDFGFDANTLTSPIKSPYMRPSRSI